MDPSYGTGYTLSATMLTAKPPVDVTLIILEINKHYFYKRIILWCKRPAFSVRFELYSHRQKVGSLQSSKAKTKLLHTNTEIMQND